MATIVRAGESIEGNKINGTSRKPADYRGIILENGRKLHKFIARFNTRSAITEELKTTDKKIKDTANTSLQDKIVCEDVVLRSLDRRFTSDHISNASGTHGASSWTFSRQTNVMITRSHQEIENGIRKRELSIRQDLQQENEN